MKQLLLTKLLLTPLAFFALAAPASALAKGVCKAERIDFNCDTHKVTLVGSGLPSTPLNCGRSTPTNFNGKIGSTGKALGTYWPSMRGAPKINIGLGAVVVHMLPPKNGRTPTGYNTNANHTGCLNVAPQVMKEISNCQGTPYKITYQSKGRRNANSTARRSTNTNSNSSRYAGAQ